VGRNLSSEAALQAGPCMVALVTRM